MQRRMPKEVGPDVDIVSCTTMIVGGERLGGRGSGWEEGVHGQCRGGECSSCSKTSKCSHELWSNAYDVSTLNVA